METKIKKPLNTTFSRIKREYLLPKQISSFNSFYKRKNKNFTDRGFQQKPSTTKISKLNHPKILPKQNEKKPFQIINKTLLLSKLPIRINKPKIRIDQNIINSKSILSNKNSIKTFSRSKMDEYKFNSAVNNKTSDLERPSIVRIKKTKISLSNYKIRKGDSFKKSLRPMTQSQMTISNFDVGQINDQGKYNNFHLLNTSKKYIKASPQTYLNIPEVKKNSHLELKFLLKPNNNYKKISFLNSELESNKCVSMNESKPSIYSSSITNSLNQSDSFPDQKIFQKKYMRFGHSLNQDYNDIRFDSNQQSIKTNDFIPNDFIFKFDTNKKIFLKKANALKIKTPVRQISNIQNTYPDSSVQKTQTFPDFNKNNISGLVSNVTPKSSTKRIILKNFNFNSPLPNNEWSQKKRKLSKNHNNIKSSINLKIPSSNTIPNNISKFNEYHFVSTKINPQKNICFQSTKNIPTVDIPSKIFQINPGVNINLNLTSDKPHQNGINLDIVSPPDLTKNNFKLKPTTIKSNLPLLKADKITKIEKIIPKNDDLISFKNENIDKKTHSEISKRTNRFEKMPSLQDIKIKKPGKSILRKSKSKQ